nr:uncharacterized protein LOC111511788 [Leptinotarsa decemlineata]
MNGERKIEDRMKGIDKILPWMQWDLLEESQIEGMIEVYVDAGARKGEERMGIGRAYERNESEWVLGNEKIPEQSSVNEAELITIERVIEMWGMNENVRVISDSAIAVERMKVARVKNKRVAMIQRMVEPRYERGARTEILWRRGHRNDNLGNEKAHKAATKGLRKDSISWNVRKMSSKNDERKTIKGWIME